jgi:hypothetical protein
MVRSRNHYITVTSGMSGFFAVMRAEYEDAPGVWNWDNVQTGIGRYKTGDEAAKEGKEWAESEGIEFKR